MLSIQNNIKTWLCSSLCHHLVTVQKTELTRVECLHIAVKQTDIHASHVDNIEQSCDNQAPHTQQDSDQNIDRKQQICQQEQVPSVKQAFICECIKHAGRYQGVERLDLDKLQCSVLNMVDHLLFKSFVPAVFLMKQNLAVMC